MKPLILAVLLVTAPALARSEEGIEPVARTADPRVRTLTYDPQQIYRIVGTLRSATQVVFAADETIEHVALGDSAAWEVSPQGNVLFLKPLSVRRATNLILTTRRGDQTRHYAFELTARSGEIGRATPNTFFQVRIQYPEDAKADAERRLDGETLRLEQLVTRLKLDRGVLSGPRNLDYSIEGSSALAPSEVSDNGRFTVLRFPGSQPLPVIYSVSPGGTESLVAYDVRGEFVVVHSIHQQLRLRRGRELACLRNRGFNPLAPPTGTRTSAPDVERIDRQNGAVR